MEKKPDADVTSWPVAQQIDALEQNLWSMWSVFGRPQNATLIDTPELFAFETPVARIPYNAVMRTMISDARANDVEAVLDERMASCSERGVPLVWMVNPTAQPTDLRRRLINRGYEHVEDLLGMVGNLGRIVSAPVRVPDDVSVVPRQPDDPSDWMSLVEWRYDIPADQREFLEGVYRAARVDETTLLWVAHRNGEAVAKAAVHLAGGVAGVYGVATHDSARGLGLAWVCTIRALQDAYDRGYRNAILHSTPMAISMYRKLGFRDVAPFELFTQPGQLDLSSA